MSRRGRKICESSAWRRLGALWRVLHPKEQIPGHAPNRSKRRSTERANLSHSKTMFSGGAFRTSASEISVLIPRIVDCLQFVSGLGLVVKRSWRDRGPLVIVEGVNLPIDGPVGGIWIHRNVDFARVSHRSCLFTDSNQPAVALSPARYSSGILAIRAIGQFQTSRQEFDRLNSIHLLQPWRGVPMKSNRHATS